MYDMFIFLLPSRLTEAFDDHPLVGSHVDGTPAECLWTAHPEKLCSVPRDLPKTAELLHLSRHHIKELHRGDFQNTTFLRFLNILWNSLEDIDPETFLDLSHNRLRNMSDQRSLLHTGYLLVLNLVCNHFLTMTLGSEFRSLIKLDR